MPKNKRERSKKRKIRSIVKKYNFEFLVTFLIFLGLFLLLEDFEIKSFIKTFSFQIYTDVKYIIFLFFNSIF